MGVKWRKIFGLAVAAAGLGSAISLYGLRPAEAVQIDWTQWRLMEPDGAQYDEGKRLSSRRSPYFYRTDDDWLGFADIATGTTSRHSKHPRSELRELNGQGKRACWMPEGQHTLTCCLRVRQADSRNVVIGQVYNMTDGIPIITLGYTPENKLGGNLRVLYETERGHGHSTPLAVPIALGEPFFYQLREEDGELQVRINGEVVYEHEVTVPDKVFYFKCGNYDQSAVAGEMSDKVLSRGGFQSIAVAHPEGSVMGR